MPTLKEVLDAFQWRSPRAIADALRAAGARGRPRVCRECALAAYVADRLGDGSAVEVGWNTILAEHPDGGREVAETSLALQEFVTRFDCGDYPELTQRGVPADG